MLKKELVYHINTASKHMQNVRDEADDISEQLEKLSGLVAKADLGTSDQYELQRLWEDIKELGHRGYNSDGEEFDSAAQKAISGVLERFVRQCGRGLDEITNPSKSATSPQV